jgi:hypothetical protein
MFMLIPSSIWLIFQSQQSTNQSLSNIHWVKNFPVTSGLLDTEELVLKGKDSWEGIPGAS